MNKNQKGEKERGERDQKEKEQAKNESENENENGEINTQQRTRKRPRRESNPSLILPCWRYATARPQRQLVRKKKRKGRTTSEEEKQTKEFPTYIRGNSKQTEYNRPRKQKANEQH